MPPSRRYQGFKVSDPEHEPCWFPQSYVQEVTLKPSKMKSTVKAVLASRRMAAALQPEPEPEGEALTLEAADEEEPEPGAPVPTRSTLRADPKKVAAARVEAAEADAALVKKELRKARKKFDQMDTDKSGTLDKDEVGALSLWVLTSFLKSEGTLELTRAQQQAETDKLFHICDTNGDGVVDFEEFASWFTPTCKEIHAFRDNEAAKLAQRKAQKRAAKAPPAGGVGAKRTVRVDGPALGLRKKIQGSAGLQACCGTPQAHGRKPKVQNTSAGSTRAPLSAAERPVDMDHKRQQIDVDPEQQPAMPAASTATRGSPTPMAGGGSSPPPPPPGSPASVRAGAASAAAARTRSATPPRMTRAGLQARMEQARALSPRRTASGPAGAARSAAGARMSTPPRSGTPPRRAVITSDALGAKIQKAKGQ